MKRFLVSTLAILFLSLSSLSANWGCDPCCCSWNGVYVGFNGGWGWAYGGYKGTPFGTNINAVLSRHSHNLRPKGVLFGGQVGFNWQCFRCFAFGVEGDFDGAMITEFKKRIQRTTTDFVGSISGVRPEITWVASVRARLGIPCGCSMPYVTAGAAWSHLKLETIHYANVIDQNDRGAAASGNSKHTRTGWVAGFGWEWKICQCWSVRAEYLHYQFKRRLTNSTTFEGPAVREGLEIHLKHNSLNTLRFGVNYIFGLGGFGGFGCCR